MIDVPTIGIVFVASVAAVRAGVAFARIRSTLSETNFDTIVVQFVDSPEAFCSSKTTLSPSFSVRASLKPFVAASRASC